MEDTPQDNPQDRTVRTFEQGAFSKNETGKPEPEETPDEEEVDEKEANEKYDRNPELEENERKLTEVERELEEPTGTEFAYPLADDQKDELDLREGGFGNQQPADPDQQVSQILYEKLGYHPDLEDTCTYPIELTGKVDIDVGGGKINVTYELEKDRIVNLRSPGLRNEVEKDEVAQELTPAENVGVEVYSDDPDSLQVEFLYDREDLTEGSLETADKLEQVEEALTGTTYSGR